MNRRLSWNQELAEDRVESAERVAARCEMDGDSVDLMDVDVASRAAPSSTSSTALTAKKFYSANKIVRRATVYKYWTHHVRNKLYQCNYCTKKYRDANSSTILNTHTSTHANRIAGKSKPPTNKHFQPKEDCGIPKLSPKQKALIDEKLKRLITARNFPFSLVDYAEFIEFTQALCPSYTPPSRKTLKAWLFADYEVYNMKIKAELEAAPGKIALTLDDWTSPAQGGYLGVTAHWVTSDFEMRRVLLDIRGLPAEHTADNIWETLLDILRDFEIAHKTLGHTVDGAASMKKNFADILPELRLEK